VRGVALDSRLKRHLYTLLGSAVLILLLYFTGFRDQIVIAGRAHVPIAKVCNGGYLREISNLEYLICLFVTSITEGRHTEKAPSVARETSGTGEMFHQDSFEAVFD